MLPRRMASLPMGRLSSPLPQVLSVRESCMSEAKKRTAGPVVCWKREIDHHAVEAQWWLLLDSVKR